LRLKEIAKSSISYVAALIVSREFRERVGNLDIMPAHCFGKSPSELADLIVAKADSERSRINKVTAPNDVLSRTKEVISRLESSLENEVPHWKFLFPGRTILKTFCSSEYANFDFGRFKLGYLKTAESNSPSPFSEIEKIFEYFSNYPT
jgi:hypothetical protein